MYALWKSVDSNHNLLSRKMAKADSRFTIKLLSLATMLSSQTTLFNTLHHKNTMKNKTKRRMQDLNLRTVVKPLSL